MAGGLDGAGHNGTFTGVGDALLIDDPEPEVALNADDPPLAGFNPATSKLKQGVQIGPRSGI